MQEAEVYRSHSSVPPANSWLKGLCACDEAACRCTDQRRNELLSQLPRLNDDVRWREYRVGRAWRLAVGSGCDGEDVQFASAPAHGIQVVGIVPEALLDESACEQSGIGSDRRASVEVEDL